MSQDDLSQIAKIIASNNDVLEKKITNKIKKEFRVELNKLEKKLLDNDERILGYIRSTFGNS